MRTQKRIAVLSVLLAIAGAACDDGKSASLPTTKPADTTDTPDNSASEPDAGPQSFLLTAWVDGLVEERTSDSADPDTVDDKVIVDTDDPAAFDKYL